MSDSTSPADDKPTQLRPAEPAHADADSANLTRLDLADPWLAGEDQAVDVTGLQPTELSALQRQHAQGMIEVQRKAHELKLDVHALDQTLQALTEQTSKAVDTGVSVTATHSQTTALGHTEIVVGNTERAARGKLAGGDANPLHMAYIIAGAIVVGALLIAAIVA